MALSEKEFTFDNLFGTVFVHFHLLCVWRKDSVIDVWFALQETD